ncbi:MAG: ribosome-binding factor A [Phycisphaerales bacterium JB065]
MNRRIEQMSSVIHRAAQSVLNAGFGDPRLDGLMLTITSVKVTADMRTAVLNVSVLPANKERRALAGLKAASKHVRRQVGDLVSIHQLPEFVFKVDKAAKRQAEVLDALAKVRAEEESRGINHNDDSDIDPVNDNDIQAEDQAEHTREQNQ